MDRSDQPYIAIVLRAGTTKVVSIAKFLPQTRIDGFNLEAVFAYQAADGTNYVILAPTT